ncbi:dephospho-CoA kinase [Endozoicomonas sp. SM1973]|uniref:Dephospho-CoA kinase n=1 Tax=Spartinivicinus marinus TaxID=2994442 RepID=A0A853I2G1_9GAMM|nr:dephospho-CoA kinase [Spartinivicinus marinus]MCX4028327.1 dephospho-CoA kinase [Spartinivicinus marinus]NYZ65662.1 dephospho-CoA kinase [Spartinivicinus marinus]
MVYKIGITGGIGSGKTAATDYLANSKQITIVDADIIARQVVEPGSSALSVITEHFGIQVLLEDGSLNRQYLRQLIFNSSVEKKWLESLLHPLIRQQIIVELELAISAYAVLVSPLLFETNQHLLVDRTLLIDVPETIQITRACQRDKMSKEQAQRILATQMPREKKRQKANDIINNQGSLQQLYAQLDQLHQQYLGFACHD